MLSDDGKRKVEQRFNTAVQMAEWFHVKSIMGYSRPELGCVYAFEMSDNTVKIGITRNTDKRVKGVQRAVYLDVLRVHQTIFAPLEFMRIIEARCHATFIDRRVRGEYFDITFEEACAELDRYAEEIAAKFDEADKNFLDEFLYYEELKKNYLNSKPSLVDKPAAEQKPRKCHDIIAGYAFVYVFLLSNDKVKIGCSGNPRARAAEIKRKTGLTIKRVYLSPAMPRERAFFVEWACQENFSSSRVKGEIFSVDFAEVCAVLDIFASKISLPLNSKLNIATVNLIAAEKSE